MGIFISTFPLPCAHNSERGEGWGVNPAQMPKDLMIHDFWWRLHRNLNRASHSRSKELWSTQGTMRVHTPPWLTGPLQQPAQEPLSLLLFPRSHSPLCRLRDPFKTWALSHGFHDQSLSDSLALSESNSGSYKVLQGSSWPAPMASLPHPLPFPSPHTLSFSHPGLGCWAKTPGSFLAASA